MCFQSKFYFEQIEVKEKRNLSVKEQRQFDCIDREIDRKKNKRERKTTLKT